MSSKRFCIFTLVIVSISSISGFFLQTFGTKSRSFTPPIHLCYLSSHSWSPSQMQFHEIHWFKQWEIPARNNWMQSISRSKSACKQPCRWSSRLFSTAMPTLNQAVEIDLVHNMEVIHEFDTSLNVTPAAIHRFLVAWITHRLANKGLGIEVKNAVGSEGPLHVEFPTTEGQKTTVRVEAAVDSESHKMTVTSRLFEEPSREHDSSVEDDVTVSEESAMFEEPSPSRGGFKNLNQLLRKALSDLKFTGNNEQMSNGINAGLATSTSGLEAAISAFRKSLPQIDETKVGNMTADADVKMDPDVSMRANEEGVRLERFKGVGVEQQVMDELQRMVKGSQHSGFLNVLKQVTTANKNVSTTNASSSAVINQATANPEEDGPDALAQPLPHVSSKELISLMEAGQNQSSTVWKDILSRTEAADNTDDVAAPVVKFPVTFQGTELKGGIDILAGPTQDDGLQFSTPAPSTSLVGQQEHLSPPNPATLEQDKRNLALLIHSLNTSAPELSDMILDSYKDLLLSDNIVFLLKEANATVPDRETRLHFSKVAKKAEGLLTELVAMMKQESARHLRTIHDICEIAGKHQHNELEFLNRLDEVKPRFDVELLSYLKFAIQEELKSIAKRGANPMVEPTKWLQVLRIVFQGVSAELESRFDGLLEALHLVVRFEEPDFRRELLARFVAITPAIDLPHLRDLAVNMAEGVLAMEEASPGRIPDPTIPEKMRQLRRDVDEVLSESYITEKLCRFDEEAQAQGQELRVRSRGSFRPVDAEDDALDEGETKLAEERGLPVKQALSKRKQHLIEAASVEAPQLRNDTTGLN